MDQEDAAVVMAAVSDAPQVPMCHCRTRTLSDSQYQWKEQSPNKQAYESSGPRSSTVKDSSVQGCDFLHGGAVPHIAKDPSAFIKLSEKNCCFLTA